MEIRIEVLKSLLLIWVIWDEDLNADQTVSSKSK